MSFLIPVSGSERQHPDNSEYAGQPVPNDPIQVTIVLKRNTPAPHLTAAVTEPLDYHHFTEQHGATEVSIAAVEAFAAEHHLAVVEINPAARTVVLRGQATDMANAFQVDLQMRKVGESLFRTREGQIKIPAFLADDVAAVLGLDERPAAASYHTIQPRAAASVAYTTRQLTQIYNFPASTGKDQTIALIELGGGYKNTDLKHYWTKLGLPNVSVAAVSVGGAQNAPTGDAGGPDGEVVLDIEVAGAVAPGARIVVYFAPNTDAGFLAAINAAIHDRSRKPSVISISWGMAENNWTAQAMDAFNAAFHDAALLGISVCVASGDNGSSDGESDGKNHADFPASSPWVLACGGTSLLASNGKIQSETVWNDGTEGAATGGGISSHFTKPTYQSGFDIAPPTGTANTSGRGVPDISAVADPATGYTVLVDGTEMVVGGTSAVAPLWAGLIALMNEQLGKNLGWFHPALYGTVAQHKALNDITAGNNGAFNAGKSWDACTGLGSPNGQAILNLLRSATTK
jgi:kumamolisin